MWLCPVCKKDNIENASSCLYCGNGRYCSDCLLPYVGDVCTMCGKSHLNGLWVTEKEYEEYLASRENSSISDKSDDKDNEGISMAVGFSKAVDFDMEENCDNNISDDSDVTEENKGDDSEADVNYFVVGGDFGQDNETLDTNEIKNEQTICDATDGASVEENIVSKTGSDESAIDESDVDESSIEESDIEQTVSEEIIAEDAVNPGAETEQNTADEASDMDVTAYASVSEDGAINAEESEDGDGDSQTSDEEITDKLKDEEKNYNALWIFLLSAICVVAIFAYTLFTIKPWKDEISDKQSVPIKPKLEIASPVDSDNKSDVGDDSSLGSDDELSDSTSSSYVDDNMFEAYSDGEYSESFGEQPNNNELTGSKLPTDERESTLNTNNVDAYASVGNEKSSSKESGNNFDQSRTMPVLQMNNSDFKALEQASMHISAGYNHIIAIGNNGSVVAAGNNDHKKLDVSKLSDVKTVSARGNHSVALLNNGTAKAAGSNTYGRCDVSGWSSLIDVKAGSYHTLGLKSDGSVVATGRNDNNQCSVSGWKDIIAISAGAQHSVALKSDGTVVALGDNTYGQCNVSGWKDIIQISAGDRYTIGLKSDGSVVACGDNARGQCNVGSWNSIVYVSSGMTHTLGLRADGTVVASGYNKYGECNVSSWENVASVSAGGLHFSVALFKDGTVKVIGNNVNNIFDASKWTQIAM